MIRSRSSNVGTFNIKNLQKDSNCIGAYVPQIWGGADQLVRRNLLLNTATLATQNVTVLGLSYTLYLKGTGSVTLSGAATGTLNGTGAGNRVSLQFTATAGTLTLTVSGSVTEGHLTRTATSDHSYQAITDWTTEVYQYNAQRNLPWLRRNRQGGYTESFSSGWTFVGSIGAYNGGDVPSTYTTAVTYTGSASIAWHYFVLTAVDNYYVGNVYEGSISVKQGTCSCAQIQFHGVAFGAEYANFDLANGVVGNKSASVTASIVSEGNGWYRCIASCACIATTLGTGGFYISQQDSPTAARQANSAASKTLNITGFATGVGVNIPYQRISTTWPAEYTALAQAAGYPITLYSDRAGTIAVDSPETVVGIEFDLSKGATPSNNLVSNGEFPSDAAGWKASPDAASTDNAIMSVASGALVLTNYTGGDMSNLRVRPDVAYTVVVGEIYLVEAEVKNNTSGYLLRLGVNNTGTSYSENVPGPTTTSTGKLSFLYTATSTTLAPIVRNTGITTAGTSFSIDNVSLRKISGNHLVAPTDAARPLLKRDGNGNYYLLRDLVDDSLNVTLPNYGSNCVHYRSTDKAVLKDSAITLNGATAFSVPSVDYGRVLLSGPSNNDAKIQKYLDALAGRSSPAVLGPELVVNGDFSGGTTSWVENNASTTLSVVSGELVCDMSAVSAGGGTQQLSLTVGKRYLVQARARFVSGDSCQIAIINNARNAFIYQGWTMIQLNTATTTFEFTATEINSHVYCRCAKAAATGTYRSIFDDISVKEILS